MRINQQLKNKYPWGEKKWTKRTELIAGIIPAEVSVLDLGGGFCELEKYLKDCFYISMDKKRWTDHTLKADFNNDQFPILMKGACGKPVKYHYMVCAGTLEYINNPKSFLEKIKKYGDILILTYKIKSDDIENKRNEMTFDELEGVLKEIGWQIIFERFVTKGYELSETQKLFYCSTI